MAEKIMEFHDKTNFKSNKYFHINSCGKQKTFGYTYPLLRSHGRIDYHILYVIEGEGVIIKNDEEILLEAGKMILYKPHEKQHYRFNPPNAQSYWIHFSGIGVEEVLKGLNLWTKSIYHLGSDDRIFQLFEDIIRESTLKEYQYQLVCEGKLLELLGLISRIATNKISANTSDNRNLIYSVIEQLREDPCQKTDSEDLAALCGLSRSRFEHMFKEVTGMPPYRYQIKIRLDKARYLLKNTQLNISEISSITGFNDPLYFSRIFKKFIGCPPSEYRSKNSD